MSGSTVFRKPHSFFIRSIRVYGLREGGDRISELHRTAGEIWPWPPCSSNPARTLENPSGVSLRILQKNVLLEKAFQADLYFLYLENPHLLFRGGDVCLSAEDREPVCLPQPGGPG